MPCVTACISSSAIFVTNPDETHLDLIDETGIGSRILMELQQRLRAR